MAPDGSRFESWQWCDLSVHELTSSLPKPNPSVLWDSARTDCWNVFFQRCIWPSSSPTKWTCSQERPGRWCPGNAPVSPCSPGELSSASLPFRSAAGQWLTEAKPSSSFPTRHHQHGHTTRPPVSRGLFLRGDALDLCEPRTAAVAALPGPTGRTLCAGT